MRILHTSDWHLGRTFFQESLLEDQAHLLEQVMHGIKQLEPDALIIAGDIFDRPNPKRDSVALFDDFLTQVYHETKTAIIAIAGNHDSPERLAFGHGLQDARRVLIRGPLEPISRPLILEDKEGKVAFSALPFGEIYSARSTFKEQTIAAPEDVLKAQIRAARSFIPTDCRWVVTAHAFVAGGTTTESERPLALVGGIETVSPAIFEDAHYVALGHLHRQQQAGRKHIRYSGSWMGFNFDEANQQKSYTLIELDGKGAVSLELVPFSPRRQIRIIEGRLAQLIAAGRENPTSDLVEVHLTDEGALLDPMGQLRAVLPNVMNVKRMYQNPAQTSGRLKLSRDIHEPHKLVAAFSQEVRGQPLSEAENNEIFKLLARIHAEPK